MAERFLAANPFPDDYATIKPEHTFRRMSPYIWTPADPEGSKFSGKPWNHGKGKKKKKTKPQNRIQH